MAATQESQSGRSAAQRRTRLSRYAHLPLFVLAAGSWARVTCAQATPADIEVTAAKREMPLIDTPMSVTVLTATDLKQTHADDFADIAALIPGLSYTDSGPGNKRYALRGLQSAGEPEVALYYDEIPISGIPGGSLDTGDSQPDVKLWDVERVEILRGPQGALYGNGSMGGAIRILSKRPVLDRSEGAIEASASVTDGGGPSWRLNAMTNIPIGETIAVRLTGYLRREAGWIDDLARSDVTLPQIDRNDLNWEHDTGGRASVIWKPDDRLTLTAIGYYQDLRTGNSFETYPDFATSSDSYVSKAFVRTPWRDRSRMANLLVNYDLDWAELFATGSYQHRSVQRSLDTTRYLLAMFGCTVFTPTETCSGRALAPAVSYSTESVDAWSGEVRMASRMSGPLQWTIGAFVQSAKTYRDGQIATVDAQGYPIFDAAGVAAGRLFARSNRDSFKQYAGFGELSYVPVAHLTATVGLRWFHSDRSDQQTLVQQFFPGAPTGLEPYQSFRQSKLYKTFELSYGNAGHGLVYAQAAQGFRAGGPNFPGGFTTTAPPYGADSVWDYELGWKASLADGHVYWQSALFDIEWSRVQQLVPTTLFSYIINGGNARSRGFETQISVIPVTGLTLSGGLTYNDARLVGAQPVQTSPALQTRSGDRLANVPAWTATASAAYTRTIGSGYTATGRIDANYQSSRASVTARTSPYYLRTPGYVLCDLHASLETPSRIEVTFDVDNLFNRFAAISAKYLDANLVPSITAARPRTARLGFAYRF